MTDELYENATNWTFYANWNISATQEVDEVNNTLPYQLRFNGNSLTVVLVYSALFVVAAVGNLTVFISLFKSRHRKSRISLMIRHLAMADLLVTFVMIPLEVGWRITVQWIAGNFACKAFLFLRAFGLYLSSNVLVCVSLDRYFAVLHPLRVNDARRRGKIMLAFAWGMSLLCAIPQSMVFHVAQHPDYPTFYQCVSFEIFSPKLEIVYNLFCVSLMYFLPLVVIVVAYTCIMCEISHKSRDTLGDSYQTSSGRMQLRRSDISNIERARSRTLKMTITIVVVFVWCWTPYVVMTLWYMFDRDSAAKLPTWLQDGLFMMAVSNSCMNPLVYGSYAINFRRECCKCLECFRAKTGQNNLPVGSSATRSTAIPHTIPNDRSPSTRPSVEFLEKNLGRHITHEKSVGRISFLSEQMPAQGFRPSFHSELCKFPDENKGESSLGNSVIL